MIYPKNSVLTLKSSTVGCKAFVGLSYGSEAFWSGLDRSGSVKTEEGLTHEVCDAITT